MRFKQWLILQESASRPGAKQGLYPVGYGGIALYPPNDIINWSADAVTYMPRSHRRLEFKWGDDMLSNPNPGEPLNFGHDEIEGEGLIKFKWGQGMQAKPSGICTLQQLGAINGKPDSDVTADRSDDSLEFKWGKGILSKPKGLSPPQ